MTTSCNIRLAAFSAISAIALSEYSYREELTFSPYSDVLASNGSVVARWRFDQSVIGGSDGSGLFPASVAELARRAQFDFAVLSLRKGAWNAAVAQAYPDSPSPPGLLLRARWQESGGAHHAPASVSAAWPLLLRTFGGLTCHPLGGNNDAGPAYGGSSHTSGVQRRWYTSSSSSSSSGGGCGESWEGAMDESAYHTAAPAHSNSSCTWQQMLLPSAGMCTETLAAVQSLLPCGRRAGLSSALLPDLLFAADWHEIRILISNDMASERSDPHTRTLQLRIDVTATLALTAVSRSAGAGDQWLLGPATAAAGPAHTHAVQLHALTACPLSSETTVQVCDTPNSGCHALPLPWLAAASAASAASATSGTSERSRGLAAQLPATRCLRITRSVMPTRLGHGSLTLRLQLDVACCAMHGCGKHATVRVTAVEWVPWFLQRVPGTEVLLQGSDSGSTAWSRVQVIDGASDVNGTAVAAQPGALLQVVRVSGPRAGPAVHLLSLPPLAVGHWALLSYAYTATMLHAEELPPDTHRGVDVAPVRVRACWSSEGAGRSSDSSGSGGAECSVAWSNPATVELPAPDFSMPYNVITLVTTLMAFLLGAFINTTARRKALAPGASGA